MDKNGLILRPLITEKSTLLRDSGNKYCFEVHKSANKIMLKKLFATKFDVKVTSCSILNKKGKKRRTRYGTSYGSGHKKAIITLLEGQTLEFYEGV